MRSGFFRVLVRTAAAALLATVATGADPAAQTASPRLLVGLAASGKTTAVRLSLRNLSSRPVSFRSLTRLSLRRAEEAVRPRPPYWAPLDLRSARSPDTDEPRPVTLGPGESRDLVVDLRDLSWGEGDCACWPDGTLTRVVVPGRYELLAEIEDPEKGFWWRSSSAVAVMKRSRALEVSFE